jgi:hypothetical protein
MKRTQSSQPGKRLTQLSHKLAYLHPTTAFCALEHSPFRSASRWESCQLIVKCDGKKVTPYFALNNALNAFLSATGSVTSACLSCAV